jgi:hypothetical protein
MCVLGRSFLGRKHALMPLVLLLDILPEDRFTIFINGNRKAIKCFSRLFKFFNSYGISLTCNLLTIARLGICLFLILSEPVMGSVRVFEKLNRTETKTLKTEPNRNR